MADQRGRPTVRPYRLSFAVLADPLLPGGAKEQLHPALTLQATADLTRALLVDTLNVLGTLPVGNRAVLAKTNAGELEMINPLLPEQWKLLSRQDGGVLESMRLAFDALFNAGAEAVMVIRSDVPLLPLDEVFEALLSLPKGKRVVLGPTKTRGVYLFGLSRHERTFLEGLELSGQSLVDCIVAHAEALELDVAMMKPLYTVETLDDLRRLYDDIARRNAMLTTAQLLERDDFVQLRLQLEEEEPLPSRRR